MPTSQVQPSFAASASPVETQMYVAAYDFVPEEEGEIELKRDDRIRMLDQSDPNWWKGQLHACRMVVFNLHILLAFLSLGEVRGKVGLFPATYVRPL